MLKNLQELWLRLIGRPPDFSLESRIYHSISIGVLVLAVFYIPYNAFAGLYVAAVSCVFLSALFSIQYYRSRVHKHPPSTALFAITGLVIFSVNYFANSGIHGSTDIIWPSYLLLVFAISPYRQHTFWLVVYLIVFFILHITAYQYPHLVKYPFNIGKGQLTDRLTAFPLPVIGIYIVIRFIRRSYDKERVAADEKAIAIEARNQQILLQTHQLEQSNAEKNKLMSIVSHDMRAPLTHIQGYLELLNSHVLESHERPALEQQLLAATNSTLEMLTNMLQWSRAQMEGSGVHLANINLLKTIQATLEMGKTQAGKKDISYNYIIHPDITVTADVDMLQLVVRNLVSNAIKFTPVGGTINIDAKPIGNECKITVADNGNGIDREKQDKIFSISTEPAFGTNNEKGVGLGLLLCKEFTERQGGRIGFESVFGQGSSFFIFIAIPVH